MQRKFDINFLSLIYDKSITNIYIKYTDVWVLVISLYINVILRIFQKFGLYHRSHLRNSENLYCP